MQDHQSRMHSRTHAYGMLALNLLVSGVIMYLVMFVMIASWSHFHHNLNMFYMTLMMVAPMAVLMIVTMASMYTNKSWNYAIVIGFAVVFVGAFLFIRQQTTIGDAQFLRSMIPHHSGAILMCEEARLTDPEIESLCQEIVRSQRNEIEVMTRMLERY